MIRCGWHIDNDFDFISACHLKFNEVQQLTCNIIVSIHEFENKKLHIKYTVCRNSSRSSGCNEWFVRRTNKSIWYGWDVLSFGIFLRMMSLRFSRFMKMKLFVYLCSSVWIRRIVRFLSDSSIRIIVDKIRLVTFYGFSDSSGSV